MPVKPNRDDIAPSELANCKVGHIAPKLAGKKGRCAECHRITQAKWRAANSEKARQSVQAWRERNRQHCRDYTKQWDAKNPGLRAIVNAAYYAANAERMRERTKKYWRANPEKAKALMHKRLAREKNAGGTHTESDLKAIFKAQRGKCAYCKTDLRRRPSRERHLDHIVSIAAGGTNDRTNLQFTCQPCNQKKNKKDPIVFARQIGLLL